MTWSLDRTVDVLFWGVVSGVLQALLHALGLCSCWTVFLAAWLLSAGTSIALSTLTVSPSRKAVLVTGCDSGFGHSFALVLDKLGFRVFAGCLRAEGEGAEHLRREGSSRLHVLQMDVTSQEQLDKAAQEVKRLLPEGEVLWGLVNNAGVSAIGAVEWVPLNLYRIIAEVNVFGVISVTKTFLPFIRRTKGRLVMMSSISGSLGRELLSPYTHTKYSVEGFANCLRYEMKTWGVDVSLVEPGNFTAATNISTEEHIVRQMKNMWATMDEDVKADYGKDYFESVINACESVAKSGNSDMTPVLQAMTEAVTQRFPRARYRVLDNYSFFKLMAAIHLPEWFFEFFYLTPQPPRQLRENTKMQAKQN